MGNAYIAPTRLGRSDVRSVFVKHLLQLVPVAGDGEAEHEEVAGFLGMRLSDTMKPCSSLRGVITMRPALERLARTTAYRPHLPSDCSLRATWAEWAHYTRRQMQCHRVAAKGQGNRTITVILAKAGIQGMKSLTRLQISPQYGFWTPAPYQARGDPVSSTGQAVLSPERRVWSRRGGGCGVYGAIALART